MAGIDRAFPHGGMVNKSLTFCACVYQSLLPHGIGSQGMSDENLYEVLLPEVAWLQSVLS